MDEPITVLIADDEHLVRRGLRHLLSKQPNFRIVAEATNGLEAVEMTIQHRPQIILMDVRMPVLDGLMALEKIQTMNLSSNTVILSGYSDFAYAQKAIKLGACDYILKPTDLPELVNVLARLKDAINQEEQEQQEKMKLKTQLSYGIPAFIENFYRKLLDADFCPDELAEKMRILEIKEEKASVLLISLDNYYQLKIASSKEQFVELYLRIKSLLHEFLGNKSAQTMPVLEADEDFFILIHFSASRANVLQFAKDLKEWLKAKTGASFSIAIGPEQPLKDLNVSYYSAVSRLKQRLITGRDSIIADDLDIQDMGVCYPAELERNLAKAIRCADQAQVQLYLDHIIDRVASTGKLSPDNWSQLCFDLLEMGYKIAKEFKITQLPPLVEKVLEVSVLTTEADIRIWIINYLNEIMTRIREADSGPSMEVKKALAYIDKHFAQDLTLASVAAHIGLSPNYLSQMFKRSTGKTFLEYLVGCRLEQAKKLLKQGDVNISEISFRVGYDNPRYFSQVFARQEGVTPSQYRKNIR